MTGTASADTLREALVSAYQTNPTLTAQRQALEATDATVAIARAAGRPQVTAQVGLNRNLAQSGVLNTGGKGPTLSVGADLSLPLFTGGSVRNSVQAAKTRVEAGRATLRAVEGDVFTQAVAAYMNVIRDRAVVELNQNNVKVLETNLEATRDRFQIGDLTRTDVAQSEARLQLGRSQLAGAQGRLTTSEETYRRVIGHNPGTLAPPPPLPPLPATPDEAVRIALANNPDLVANTRPAAADYDAAQKAIQSNTVAVQANELALEGARAEQSVGTRTVLDVLNAEQELLNSQVALVTAKRDAYVAGFQLLNAMGQAEAQDLGLDGGPLYDPLGNYRRVSTNWSDWAQDPRHPTVATRTVTVQELPPNPAVTSQLVPGTVLTEPVTTSGVTQPPQ